MACTHTNINWNLAQSEQFETSDSLSLAGICEDCDTPVHGTARVEEVTPE